MADRLDRNLENTLTQEHVVETMLAAERPFFSIRQLQARVKPDVSKATVRNRLRELAELDVVATETYPESVTLYYVNHPDSQWPLSPEGKRALQAESPLDRLSTRGFLTMRDTAGIRTLVLAGFQLTLVMLALAAVESALGAGLGIETTVTRWQSAFDLLLLSILVLVAERAVRWTRDRFGAIDVLPTT